MVCFFEFLTPSTLGGHNFLNPIPFLIIFSAPYAPIGGVEVLFGHQKQQSLPLASCLHLSVEVSSHLLMFLQLNLQLKTN
jgi:hypothetical protein